MSFPIKFTDTAKEDLRSIISYIADQSKEKSVAIAFANELREKINVLKDFPEIGSIADDRVMKSFGYRYLVHRDYLIFYRYEPKEKTSYILAIFNGRRDYARILRKFLK